MPSRKRILIAVVTFLLQNGCTTQAFVSPGQGKVAKASWTEQPRTRSSSSLKSWEELVYNADSLASDWASLSLKDPSLYSLPVLYGAGLLTSVSPCVWGLLPLTMSWIGVEGRQDGVAAPTLAFAAGLATVFCTLGLVAASVGQVFGTGTLSLLLSSGVCLAMGLQVLEFIRLPLPSLDIDIPDDDDDGDDLVDQDGNVIASSQKRGSLWKTFLLGGSSALVSSPCSTPVLTSILAFVSNANNNPGLGAILLLGYTLGYATPLLVVAATGGQALANLGGGSDNDEEGWYSKVAPWITPLTGGILLWYGTNGILTSIFGDPSMAALAPVLY